jgi:hypothetical protein
MEGVKIKIAHIPIGVLSLKREKNDRDILIGYLQAELDKKSVEREGVRTKALVK